MKILIFNHEYPPLGGGGSVATKHIAQELSKRHTVHVITTAYKTLPRYEEQQGVHIHRVWCLGRTSIPTASLVSLLMFAPMAALKGISLTAAVPFDVINAQFVIPAGVPALAISLLRHIPLVVSFIGGDVYDPSKAIAPHRYALLRWIIRVVARHAKGKTAISQDTKTRAIEIHGVEPDIEVVPLGLVPMPAHPANRTTYHSSPQDILCVSIGRLVPRKGYEELLDAWKMIPDAKLIIIGDGPLFGSLQQTIKNNALENRVTLAGFVPEEEKASLLATADIYVSAAHHEGFGIVFLEAMDKGLPIVAANDGGQRDFLIQGKNAILVPPHDVPRLAQAIRDLIKNTSMRDDMRKQNLQDVKGYYIEHTAAQFERALEKATV